jgi:hypothetical protein
LLLLVYCFLIWLFLTSPTLSFAPLFGGIIPEEELQRLQRVAGHAPWFFPPAEGVVRRKPADNHILPSSLFFRRRQQCTRTDRSYSEDLVTCCGRLVLCCQGSQNQLGLNLPPSTNLLFHFYVERNETHTYTSLLYVENFLSSSEFLLSILKLFMDLLKARFLTHIGIGIAQLV